MVDSLSRCVDGEFDVTVLIFGLGSWLGREARPIRDSEAFLSSPLNLPPQINDFVRISYFFPALKSVHRTSTRIFVACMELNSIKHTINNNKHEGD